MDPKPLAKFTSMNDDIAKDFHMAKDKLVIGRKRACDHRIMHAKIR
jgi:hypothetical protein